MEHKIYEIKKDEIIVYDKTQFNPTNILECGQIFRYKKTDDGFKVYSLNKFADIFETKNEYIIKTKDINYFVNFFDLNTNYNKIKADLNKFSALQKPIKFGYGIRILKQNSFEMLISFIISANNRIPRIKSLIEKLSQKVGTNMGNFYAFPTREQMLTLTVDDLKKMGMGFRAKYLFNVVRQIDERFYEISNLNTLKAINLLVSYSGVGPKVADCVLLFGFYKLDVFPVDTWIEKVYNSYFSTIEQKNRTIIRKDLVTMFGNLSGYAKQYLFYFKREQDSKK